MNDVKSIRVYPFQRNICTMDVVILCFLYFSLHLGHINNPFIFWCFIRTISSQCVKNKIKICRSINFIACMMNSNHFETTYWKRKNGNIRRENNENMNNWNMKTHFQIHRKKNFILTWTNESSMWIHHELAIKIYCVGLFSNIKSSQKDSICCMSMYNHSEIYFSFLLWLSPNNIKT